MFFKLFDDSRLVARCAGFVYKKKKPNKIEL